MLRGGGECPNCGACKESVEHVIFECVSYDSQRLISWTIRRESFLQILLKPFFMAAFKNIIC